MKLAHTENWPSFPGEYTFVVQGQAQRPKKVALACPRCALVMILETDLKFYKDGTFSTEGAVPCGHGCGWRRKIARSEIGQ